MKKTSRTRNTVDGPPNMQQRWLLRAAFLKGSPAVEAWQMWKNTIALDDHLDIGSLRLLPPLCRNLKAHGLEDTLINRFKGVTRQAWVKNQHFFYKFQPVLKSFERAEIGVIVTGKPAMALRCALKYPIYKDNEIDLLVSPRDVSDSVAQLTTAGWRAIPWLHPHLLDGYVDAAHGHMFIDDAGKRLSLKWKVILNNYGKTQGNDFWNRSISVDTHGFFLRLLNPTDSLVAACLGAASMPCVPLFYRVVDTMLLIQKESRHIDWDYILYNAARYRYALYMRCTLNYIHANLEGCLPEGVMKRMEMITVDMAERVEGKFRRGSAKPYGYAADLLFNYYREKYYQNLLRTVLEFPTYMQHLWFLWKRRELPAQAILKILQAANRSSAR